MKVEYLKGERASRASFEPAAKEEDKPLAAMAEVDRGETMRAADILQ